MPHVGGIADLALLAVVDDVDAGLDLLADDVGDGAVHAGVEGRLLGDGAGVERFEQRGEIVRSRQTPGVGGQDAL